MVGRDGELETIRNALDEARVGRGGCLLILGEAGSGKTRLLREARQEALQRDMSVLTGAVPPDVSSPAFGVLTQAIRSWSRSNGLPEKELASFALGLHQVLPEWPLPADPPELSDAQMRLFVLEGILRLLLVVAGNAGALVVLDDLHAADPETFDFLNHATAVIGFEPLLIVGAVRSLEHGPGEARARALGRARRALLLEVRHLDEGGVGAMAEAALGAPAPPELIGDLMARTDGIPLLVEEMLAAHVAAGTLRRDDNGVRWSTEAMFVIPRTIVEITGEKLERLPEGARSPLVAAGVLGHFDLPLLSALTDLDAESVTAGLQRAVEDGLLEQTGPAAVGFRHALIRDAVMGCVPPIERGALHRRAAKALADLYGEDPERLEEQAHHWEKAGEGDRAAQLLVRAARRGLARHAPASAEMILQRSIELALSTTIANEARDVLVEALEALGRWEEGLELDRQLLARQGDDPRRLLRMARNAIPSNRLEEADALIARAAAAGADPVSLAVLSALVALWRGDVERAAEEGREALALAETGGDAELLCSALDVTGRAVAISGGLDEAAAMFRRWAALAGAEGLKMSHLQALLELGNYEFLAGGPADGLQAARALAQEAGAYSTIVLADLSLGWWLRNQGRLEESVTVSEEAVAVCRRFRLDRLPNALAEAGAARNAMAWDSGEPLLAEALALAPGDPDVLIVAESSRGETALRAGRFEEAERRLDRAAVPMREVASAVKGPAPFQRVGALLALGRTGEAEAGLAWARETRGVERLCHMPMWLAVAEALAGSSPDRFEEALASANAQAPFHRAVALVLGAEVLRDVRDVLAHEWLGEALAIFESAGARHDAARIRLLLRDLPTARRERRTLMFTDIVGSTVLVEALGDEVWERLLGWHDQTLRSLFQEHGGEEMKQVGDGFFVAFETPAAALECAVAIQRALAAGRREQGHVPDIRIGLHEAEVTRKGRDYQGRGVHEAARIGALGGPGDVIASRATVTSLRQFLLSDLRTVHLKGITEPVEVVSIEWRELESL